MFKLFKIVFRRFYVKTVAKVGQILKMALHYFGITQYDYCTQVKKAFTVVFF